MIDIERLKRQHCDILDSVTYIETYIYNNDFNKDLSELAKEVNVLAGKLKIHLDLEDQIVYPELIKKYDINENGVIKNFLEEVKGLNTAFNDYKYKYNTREKIRGNILGFIEYSNSIFELIRARIHKEEKELFLLT